MSVTTRIKSAWGALVGRSASGAMARFLADSHARNAERATRPFEQVAAVNRCIRMRGAALSSMPLMISTRDDELVESGEIIDLLDRPMPGLTDGDLVAWIDALVMLSGGCYLVIEDRSGRTPTRLRPVSAKACRPKYDRTGELSHYAYRKPGTVGSPQRLEVEDVIAFELANYQTERLHDVMSAIRPGKHVIDQVFAADLSNLESLHNGVEPGLVFDYGPNQTPTDEQRDGIYEQFDANHRGVDKKKKPIVIGGGATVSDFIKSFTDMEFATLKRMSVQEVCVLLGVPPLAAGYPGDSSLGSGKEMGEATSAFWFASVLPTANWIARKLTVNLLPLFQGRSRMWHSFTSIPRHCQRGVTYRAPRRACRRLTVRNADGRMGPAEFFAWFDSSNVDAVIDAALSRSTQAAAWTEKLGATQADVIEALDLQIPADHPWQQTWYKPFSLIDVQDEQRVGAPDDPPGGPGTSDDPDVPAEPAEPPARSQRSTQVVARNISEAQRARLWEQWRQSWTALERRGRGIVSRHFDELRREVLRRVNTIDPVPAIGQASAERIVTLTTIIHGSDVQLDWDQAVGVHRAKLAPVQRDVIGQILFDLSEAQGRLLVKASPLIRAAYELGGQQSMEEAATAEGQAAEDASRFQIDDPNVRAALDQRENKLAGVDETLHRRLRHQLAEGLENSETTTQLADRIKREFNFATKRANVIARTEVGAAVEDARHAGRRQARVPLKSWLWSRKETGRRWHMDEEMETTANPIPNDADFILEETGGRAPYPRHHQLPVRDVPNCGCTTLARFGDQRDARMIAHLRQRGFLTWEQFEKRYITRSSNDE